MINWKKTDYKTDYEKDLEKMKDLFKPVYGVSGPLEMAEKCFGLKCEKPFKKQR